MNSLAIRPFQKGVELINDVRPNVPNMLKGDPGRIRQIIINLVGNAVKFTEQGEIIVRVQLADPKLLNTSVRTDVDPNSVFIHFAVSDTGIGIPEEKLSSIFQSFSQADGSTTRKYGGTGLGLSISKKLVKLMGGQVWVESVKKKGSTFHFTACLQPAKLAGQTIEYNIDKELHGQRVLILEHNQTNQRLLNEMLTDWKFQPSTVSAPEVALKQIEQAHNENAPFKFCLLDIDFARHKKSNFIKQLIDVLSGTETKIVLIASVIEENESLCRKNGISGIVRKPIQQKELYKGLISAFGESTTSEQAVVTTKNERKPAKSLKILLAEDNLVNQKVAINLLKKWGHKVIVANNGKLALEKLHEEDFDLILMDVQMPEMDGFEATRRIRESDTNLFNSQIPIVAMTANAMKGDRERCIAAGMNDYVSKPLDIKEFSKVLAVVRDEVHTVD